MDSSRSSTPAAALTSAERAGKSGPEIVKDYVKRLPTKPGVYRMLDKAGEVLYVGKARNLKNRVGNYVRLGGHTARIARMISETAAMEFVVTETETEALLLESNLIKRLKPRHNIILRDDKSFPYILIRRDHDAPQVMKHRGARSIAGDYFGPFASAGAVNRTLNTLQKAFLIRSCSDSVYENRSRPCMLYQIKRCAAPCVGFVSVGEHARLVDDAMAFLKGDSDELRKRLQAEMDEASAGLDFERAARLRDRIRALAPITTTQGINPKGVEEADVVGLHTEGGQTCVQVFFFRAGQNWGNRAFYPRHEKDAEPAAVLAAFLGQFYDDKPAPKLVLVSHEPEDAELIAEALSLRSDRKVEILRPQRGEKTGLVEHARRNAAEALARKMAEGASQAKLLDGVKDAFELDARPNRIEVYDNSHIMGTKAVGGMVVAGPEGFEKGQYRTFNIKSEELEPGDDYGMMREVLRRRFSRLLKEREMLGADKDASDGLDHPPSDPCGATSPARGGGEHDGDAFAPPPAGELSAQPTEGGSNEKKLPDTWPDVVLLDGGQGQLSAALETLAELGLGPDDVNLVAIAKGPDRDAGRETFFQPGRAPYKLEPKDPVLYYLQRLRDEAHRFAIGAHRARRKSDITKNPLDGVPGVGPARKKALLAHFGSARSVTRASLEDLESVEGVSKQLATKIYEWFHEHG